MTETVPFTPLDEAVFHLEEELEPWNVQIEIGSAASLDGERLYDAVEAAAAAHPLARARLRDYGALDDEYVWEIPDEPDTVPLKRTEAADAGALADFRTQFYSPRVELRESPPFRVALARGGGIDGGDRLMVCGSHVAMDGVGTLRLARSICQAYRGGPIDEDPVGLAESRAVLAENGPSSLAEAGTRLAEGLGRLPDALDEPTRIAVDGGTDDSGWGFVHRELDDDLVAAVVGNRPDGVSVNDCFLAALHLAIDGWNASHGEERDRISLMMPVNARPPEWFYETVGMYAPFVSIDTKPCHRTSPGAAVERVVEQTSRHKRHDGAGWVTDALGPLSSNLPVGIKRLVPGLLGATQYRFVDSAVLSNLGRAPELRALGGDGDATDLWFSPPSMMPLGVGFGVATLDGDVRLVTRYSQQQFDRDAARRFTDRYLDRLGATVP
ncbi:hypothetical protein [Haloglomus halophilum]|uniref:hypothetical protein n=1 Tax=Haloglomus halophilum TaxID=2962672 RepID=UPI0020C97C54|nr:hypothetical protein [Haloglomus halophilum]